MFMASILESKGKKGSKRVESFLETLESSVNKALEEKAAKPPPEVEAIAPEEEEEEEGEKEEPRESIVTRLIREFMKNAEE